MQTWHLRVGVSRWIHRLEYVARAPMVYKNWWSIVMPKLGFATVLHLRNGLHYHVRPHTLDLSIINEAAFLDPYFGNGFVSLRPDATVVDVGANIGDFTIQAARLCPEGRVLAVEPLRSAGAMIERQAQLNGLRNVTWIHAAMGASHGETDAARPGSVYSDGESADQRVPMTSLARLAADAHLDRIDLLKLDCEGAEWEILPAAEGVLPRVRQICMEFHNEGCWTAEKLAEWLKTQGFEVKHTGGSWNGLLWARRSLL